MTTQPTTQQTTQPGVQPDTTQLSPVPTQRRRRAWQSLLDGGEPLAPAAGEPEAWARLAHAPQRPARRWSEADDSRPATAEAPHLATRPFFARYPLLGAGRS